MLDFIFQHFCFFTNTRFI